MNGNSHKPNGGYTSKKMLNAMFEAADELNLHAGKRYVSATICACASGIVAAGDIDKPGSVRDEATAVDHLARALEGLATTWAAYMLWPCEECC